MPFSDPGVYQRSSTLTQKQQHEQLAACFGVNMSNELSPMEAEQMRALLAKYDSKHKPATIHNLNDPPKVPYRHQKFPMMVYNHAESFPAHTETRSAIVGSSVLEETIHVKAHISTALVQDEKQLQKAIENGWSTEAPVFREDVPDTLTETAKDEVRKIDGRRRKEMV